MYLPCTSQASRRQELGEINLRLFAVTEVEEAFDAAEAAFQAEEQLLSARSSAAATSGNVPLDLVMLTDAQSKDKGAVCLDGTNPGCERQHSRLPPCSLCLSALAAGTCFSGSVR